MRIFTCLDESLLAETFKPPTHSECCESCQWCVDARDETLSNG